MILKIKAISKKRVLHCGFSNKWLEWVYVPLARLHSLGKDTAMPWKLTYQRADFLFRRFSVDIRRLHESLFPGQAAAKHPTDNARHGLCFCPCVARFKLQLGFLTVSAKPARAIWFGSQSQRDGPVTSIQLLRHQSNARPFNIATESRVEITYTQLLFELMKSNYEQLMFKFYRGLQNIYFHHWQEIPKRRESLLCGVQCVALCFNFRADNKL